jgi:GNAT superfamily N-acetyltransferase
MTCADITIHKKTDRMNISFHKVTPYDQELIDHIADWYLQEWNIPKEQTIQKISNFSTDSILFQIVMTIDSVPISTGGIYDRVGLLDREPRFRVYSPWLALVFTAPEHRNLGYGTSLCEKLQDVSKELGLKEIFLFTYTSEKLYKRLDWQELERLNLNNKDIVVMKKTLFDPK